MGDAEAGPPESSAEEPAASLERLRAIILDLQQEIARVRHDANHDRLTGLPNRALLQDRFEQAIRHALRQSSTLGLLLLDIDKFKHINDRYGHSVGDLLLQGFARRLAESLRASDTACRYGGDEFVIMLPGIDSAQHARQLRAVVRKLRARLSAAYVLDHHEIRVRVSIGAAILGSASASFDALVRAADAAMYRAKSRSQSRAAASHGRESRRKQAADQSRHT